MVIGPRGNLVTAIPLTIIGIVNHATYDARMKVWLNERQAWDEQMGFRGKGPFSPVTFGATPDGFALHF